LRIKFKSCIFLLTVGQSGANMRSCVISIIIFLTMFCPPASGKDEWRKLSRDRIILYCTPADLKNGEEVIDIAEKVIPGIAADLKLNQIATIAIVMAPSQKVFRQLTGGQFPEWGIGGADAGQSVIYLQSPRIAQTSRQLPRVVAHELSHVLLGQAVSRKPVDRWFDEGFAMYESGDMGISGSVQLAWNLLSDNPLLLYDVDDILSFQRFKANLAYQISFSAVQYLVDTYGSDALADLSQALGRGLDMDEALVHSVGVNYQAFENGWFETARRKYRWYILYDFRLLSGTGMVFLFILAFIITRQRTRKRKHEWMLEVDNDQPSEKNQTQI